MQKVVVTPKSLPDPKGRWSPAILCTGATKTLFISGVSSRDASGEVVGEGNLEAQTRQVCENLKAIVEAAGATLADIVSITTYVVDVEQMTTVHRVRASYFSKDPPASSMVQVSRLVDRRCLIEISAIAAFG